MKDPYFMFSLVLAFCTFVISIWYSIYVNQRSIAEKEYVPDCLREHIKEMLNCHNFIMIGAPIFLVVISFLVLVLRLKIYADFKFFLFILLFLVVLISAALIAFMGRKWLPEYYNNMMKTHSVQHADPSAEIFREAFLSLLREVSNTKGCKEEDISLESLAGYGEYLFLRGIFTREDIHNLNDALSTMLFLIKYPQCKVVDQKQICTLVGLAEKVKMLKK